MYAADAGLAESDNCNVNFKSTKFYFYCTYVIIIITRNTFCQTRNMSIATFTFDVIIHHRDPQKAHPRVNPRLLSYQL